MIWSALRPYIVLEFWTYAIMVLSLTLAWVRCRIWEVAGEMYGAAAAGVSGTIGGGVVSVAVAGGVFGSTGGGVESVDVAAGPFVCAGTSLNIGVGVSCP